MFVAKAKAPAYFLLKFRGIDWKKIVINRDNVEEFVRSRNTSKDYSNKTRMQRQKLYIQTYTNQLKTKLTNDYSITLQKMYDFYSKLKQLVLQLFYEEDK